MSYDWSIVKFGDFAEAHELIKGRLEVRKPLGEWLLKRPEPKIYVFDSWWDYTSGTSGYVLSYVYGGLYDVTDNDIQEFFRTNPHLLETVTTESSLRDSSPNLQPPATAKTVIPGRPLPPTRITVGSVSRRSVPPPATRTRSEPVKVTLTTPLQDLVAHLTEVSGITNLTDQLNRSLTLTEHPIANGGQADVYRATRSDGARFAVKCLRYHDTKLIKHTAKELHTWSKLDHANILKLTGLAVFQNRIAMVSPWMEYGSVSSLIADQPDQDRYELCKQLADAVEYLHNSNVVHGDIKGANVLVDSDGTVKLTDFGLAILHDQSIQFSHTTPGGGTARWMAPELFEDETELSRETDVYAMGMTMLEFITGELPFPHLVSWMSLFKAVCQSRSTPSIEKLQMEPLSPRAQIMIGILHRCWRYDPKERVTATGVVGLMKFLGPV